MKNPTKIFAVFIITIAIISLTVIPGMAAPVSDTDTAGGSITIDKTAAATADPRIFDVTLTIDGNAPPAKPLDIILVIDSSLSMNQNYGGHSSLYYAKQAATSFANQMLPSGNNTNRIAVIDFNGNLYSTGSVSRDTNLRTGFTYTNNAVNIAVNNISASGGTDTQAGFRAAKELMASSARSEADKIIILLSDGIPTMRIGSYFSINEPTSHNDNTIAAYTEGQACVAAGYKVITIGLLGGISNQQVKALAIDTLTRAQNSGFYQTNSAVDLSGIYTAIANSINYYAASAVITDRIYGDFQLVTVSIVTKINNTVVTTPAWAYDSSTKTITWPVGTLATSASLTYQIRYLDTLPGGDDIPTNTSADINYTDSSGLPNQILYFPVPTVDVHIYGSIIIHKLVSNESGSDQYFPIRVAGGPNNLEWNVLAQDDGSYTIGNLLAGTYTITETVPMDYQLHSISGPGSVSGRTITFTLTQQEIWNGTVKEFTFTNRVIDHPYFWGTDYALNLFNASSNFPAN